MTERIQDVEMQLSEVEMLQSMFPGDNEFVLDDELTLIEMKKFAQESREDPKKPMKLNLKLTLQGTNYKMDAAFTLPINYPSEENLSVLIRSQNMNKVQYKEINDAIKKYIDTLGVGELCIFQVIEWLNENAMSYISVENHRGGCEVSEKDSSEEPQHFSRLWIYSHHIYSKTKRKNILEWAKELELTGFSMPGKPGVVCVEGPEDNCEEFWQRMKRQTWKRLNLVHREEGIVAACDDDSTFVHKFTEPVTEKDFGVHGGRDYHMDLGKFAAYLSEHRSHDVFSILFGVEGKVKSSE